MSAPALTTDTRTRVVSSIALRGLTLGGRFLLLFLLAHWLTPADLGTYGLVTAVVGYGIYLIGWEFYTYSGRRLVTADAAMRRHMVEQLGILYSLSYALGVAVLAMAWWAGAIPQGYALWIAGLLLVEYLAQEVHRNLVALSRQLTASVVLFIRIGAWCFLVMAVMQLESEWRSLEWVLGAWLVFAGLACGLGYASLLAETRPGWPRRIDWRWIGQGILAAWPLFVASLSTRGMVTFDRFFLEDQAGLEVLGAYVLYMGITTAILSFLDAGVVDFSYPRLVEHAGRGELPAFRAVLGKARSRLLLMTVPLVLAALLVTELLVPVLGKPVFTDNRHLMYWLLLATALQALCLIPHLALYGMRRDTPIMLSQLVGLVVFCVGAWLLRPWGAVAVPVALCLAWTLILAWKSIACRQALATFTTPS
ncbi:lipopolysaccharide biosynthesis protein [uncultured Hydrogenophaga sp.]|uniref:lipopolysaccharide biosynthesis protein n=1 Tax=uncultured Hydrogenophaga sp. TaxID=199683 RepID=UPI002660464F|nr:hypothetical protein [uncultured Hydrogenophaga sp.]